MKFVSILFVLMFQTIDGSAIIEFFVRLAGVGVDGGARAARDLNNRPTGHFREAMTPKPTPFVPESRRLFIAELNERIDGTIRLFNEIEENLHQATPDQGMGGVADMLAAQTKRMFQLVQETISIDGGPVIHYIKKYLDPIEQELRAMKGIADWPQRNKKYKAALEKFRSKVLAKI